MKKSSLLIAGILIILAAGLAFFVLNAKDDKTDSPTTNTNSEDKSNMDMNPSQSGGSNPDNSQATNNVKIEDFAFSPAIITVKKGTKVTWKNDDSAAHTVTADDGSFGSGTMNKDDTYSFNFNTVGTFKYHCNFHTNMVATVIVTE